MAAIRCARWRSFSELLDYYFSYTTKVCIEILCSTHIQTPLRNKIIAMVGRLVSASPSGGSRSGIESTSELFEGLDGGLLLKSFYWNRIRYFL